MAVAAGTASGIEGCVAMAIRRGMAGVSDIMVIIPVVQGRRTGGPMTEAKEKIHREEAKNAKGIIFW